MTSREDFNILDSSHFPGGCVVRASVVCCGHGGQRRFIRSGSLVRIIVLSNSERQLRRSKTTVRSAGLASNARIVSLARSDAKSP
jgi:hypothetical protein